MFGRFFQKKSVVHPKAEPRAVDWSATPEGRRKLRTEQRLKSEGIPCDLWLPGFVDESVAPREGRMVVERMLGITRVAVQAARGEADEATRQLKAVCPDSFLSAGELQYLSIQSPTEVQSAQFAWRYECAWALQWALGLIPDAGDYTANCDPKLVRELAIKASSSALAEPVAKDQLLDAGDRLYRLHWACRDAQLTGKPTPGGLIAGVVWERRRAIQWLLEPDVEWDDISLDT